MSNNENNKQEITMSLDEFDSTITEAEKLIFEMEGIRTSHYNIDSDGQSPVVIDKNLDIVMIPEMPVDEIYYKSGGLYQVTITDRQGYADESGKVVIPCKYETAYPFSDSGLAFVRTPDGKSAYINKDNEIVISLGEEIVEGGIFEHGISYVSDGKTYTFINEKGEELFDEKFLYTNGFAKNGLAVVEDENNMFKFINTDGFVKFELTEGISADGFHENSNITVIRQKNKVGVMFINGSITSKCPFKDVMISRFSEYHMVKEGANWHILDSDLSLIESLILKKPTVINKQGYFVAKIDENSDIISHIADFSKSSFYVCRIKDGNIGGAYPLTGVKSVEISEDEPLLILTYAGGAKVLHYIETAENNNGIISGFFSPYVDGEAIVNLPTEIIANIIAMNAIESGKLLEE